MLVFPWIDGVALPLASAGPAIGRKIGTIRARIHGLNSGTDLFGLPKAGTFAVEWDGLLSRGKGAPWSDIVAVIRSDIPAWESASALAQLEMKSYWVVSHGDLDQKNVLWESGGTPRLIDWESVGPVRSAVEVVAAALDWSGQGVGEPDRETFVAVLEAYRQEAELGAEDCRRALLIRLGDWLGWLATNMEGSLRSDLTAEAHILKEREVVKTARTVRALSQNLETWAKWAT